MSIRETGFSGLRLEVRVWPFPSLWRLSVRWTYGHAIPGGVEIMLGPIGLSIDILPDHQKFLRYRRALGVRATNGDAA